MDEKRLEKHIKKGLKELGIGFELSEIKRINASNNYFYLITLESTRVFNYLNGFRIRELEEKFKCECHKIKATNNSLFLELTTGFFTKEEK